MIVVQSTHHDFMPSVLGRVHPDALGLDLPARLDRHVRLAVPRRSSACCRRSRSRRCASWSRRSAMTDAATPAGPDGGIRDAPEGAGRRGAGRARRRLPRAEAYAPYAVEGLAEALGFRRSRIPAFTLVGGAARRRRRLLPAVVRGGAVVSRGHRRPAAAQLADVRAGHLRDDDPVRRVHRVLRRADRQRPAAARASDLRRARLRPRHAQPLLPVPAHRRSGVRRARARTRCSTRRRRCGARRWRDEGRRSRSRGAPLARSPAASAR